MLQRSISLTKFLRKRLNVANRLNPPALRVLELFVETVIQDSNIYMYILPQHYMKMYIRYLLWPQIFLKRCGWKTANRHKLNLTTYFQFTHNTSLFFFTAYRIPRIVERWLNSAKLNQLLLTNSHEKLYKITQQISKQFPHAKSDNKNC